LAAISTAVSIPKPLDAPVITATRLLMAIMKARLQRMRKGSARSHSRSHVAPSAPSAKAALGEGSDYASGIEWVVRVELPLSLGISCHNVEFARAAYLLELAFRRQFCAFHRAAVCKSLSGGSNLRV
jgi:hypothetical protein